MKQMYGTKVGMTRIFTESGENLPVTVLKMEPNVITQVKTKEKEGYTAYQVSFGAQKPQRLSKAATGHVAKANRGVFRYTKELRLDSHGSDDAATKQLGEEITLAETFTVGTVVDVSGVTIGKGFAGVMKRHHMKGFPATRGTHEYRRHGGSIGNRKYPGRVFKNKRMGGHMGVDKVTQLGVEIVGVRPEENLLLIKGSVPGPKNGVVYVRTAVKE